MLQQLLVRCIVVLSTRPTAECLVVFLSCIKEASPPCLTGSVAGVDDPSASRQQLASAFLHSAATPAQRLDAAPQRAQYL